MIWAPFERADVLFSVATASRASLRVYNSAGELVRRLYDGEAVPGVIYRFGWNGTNDADRTCASNVFVVRLRAGRVRLVVKVAVTR